MRQKDRVLRYLKDFGSISDVEAFSEFGIRRLSARVYDLRKDGYTISTTMESGRNRYGEKTSYARYRLE